jgi:hypothetical protein
MGKRKRKEKDPHPEPHKNKETKKNHPSRKSEHQPPTTPNPLTVTPST